MSDRGFNWVMAVPAIAFGLFAFVGVPYLIHLDQAESARIERLTIECKSKGGTFLRHVVGSGKNSHNETLGCFKTEDIIPLETK